MALKEAFFGFYETETTDGKTLYDLITKAIPDLKYVKRILLANVLIEQLP